MGKNRRINPNVGTLIRYARERKNYSLKDLENKTGVSASYIMRVEKGERTCPSIPIIKALTGELGLDMAEILELSGEKSNSDVKSLSTLLLTSDFKIGDTIAEPDTKEILVELIEKIQDSEWSNESKLHDSYTITQIIDDLKAILE